MERKSESRNVPSLIATLLIQEKHDEVTDPPPPRELATLVVVEGPSTCQDSHLAGKRACQGSPLRVLPGSHWGHDTYVSNAMSPFCPAWTSPRGAAMSAPSEGRTQPHKTTTLITVSVLLMPRPLNQQAGSSWTSDICERSGNGNGNSVAHQINLWT